MAAQSQGPPYAACLQCSQHCQQIHGYGFSPCSRTPSFFSVLPPSPSSAPLSLPIPPAFLGGRNIRVDHQTSAPGESLYSEMQLEGPSGAIWNIAMQGPTLSNLAFTTGWERFVKDHSLVAGDLLFFKLFSRGSFSVSIYGSDGCEKADAFTAQNSGAISVSNAQSSKKRFAADNVPQGVGEDAEAKRRKVDVEKQVAPIVIDIDDDDDDEAEGEDCISEPQSDHACKIIGSGDVVPIVQDVVADSRDVCMLGEQKPPAYMVDAKEDKCSPKIPVDVPLTPNNAEKGILVDRLHITQESLISKEDDKGDQECLANGSDQESASSEEEDSEQDNYQSEWIKDEETSSESDSEEEVSESPLYCIDEATQRDRMKDVLAKDYLTEAFISKRRPVLAEERHRALQAAKRFKSSLPHLRKLMKESHVYRGFWLSLSSDFAIKYLPQEIQAATLLDSSGEAWSAKWLGGRNGISGGWRKFSLDHGLEEGDVCVFELIDRKKLVIKVHIFRVVELKNGLPGRDHYLHKPPSRPSLEYNCRRPSISVKKMRGAMGGSSGHWHSSTSSSRVVQRKEGQAENKRLKGKGDPHRSCKKLESNSHLQRSKSLVKTQSSLRRAEPLNHLHTSKRMVGALKAPKVHPEDVGGCSNAERSVRRNADAGTQLEEKPSSVCNTAEASLYLRKTREPVLDKGRGDAHSTCKNAAAINNTITSTNMVDVAASKASKVKDTDSGGQNNVDVSPLPEGKALTVFDTQEVSSSLETPPKTREPAPNNLRRMHLLQAARQLDLGGESGLPKAAKEHPPGSKLNFCKKYYGVERLYNRRKGAVEEEFLVDLDIDEPLSGLSSKVKKDGKAWWVPLSHFTKDKTSCHL